MMVFPRGSEYHGLRPRRSFPAAGRHRCAMTPGGAKHMSLLHWLFSLPTCEDADVHGYLRMYLGRTPGLDTFAHEFAAKKYEWRAAARR